MSDTAVYCSECRFFVTSELAGDSCHSPYNLQGMKSYKHRNASYPLKHPRDKNQENNCCDFKEKIEGSKKCGCNGSCGKDPLFTLRDAVNGSEEDIAIVKRWPLWEWLK